MEEGGVFPALRRGLVAASRDEVRHYQFGLRFLAEAVAREPAYGALVSQTVRDRMPAVLQIMGQCREVPRTIRRLQRGLRTIGVTPP
jgi:hypothetical protein